MTMETFPVPAIVATLLFLFSGSFIPSPLLAGSQPVNGPGALSSSDSGGAGCELPPYSETLSREGETSGLKLAEIPPLDSALPEKVATATFSMG